MCGLTGVAVPKSIFLMKDKGLNPLRMTLAGL